MGIFQDTHMTQSEFSWASALVFIGNLAFQVMRVGKEKANHANTALIVTQCLSYAQATYCKVSGTYSDHMGHP